MRIFVLLIGIVGSSVLAGCSEKKAAKSPSLAGQPLDVRIQSIAQPLVDDGWAKGMMVGVLQDGKEHYFSFGSIGNNKATPPDKNTVFEIGSITKVFTAITLAAMVAKQELQPNTPVTKLLPDGINIPEPGNKPITLESLASHTSGLPVIPANFWMAGDNIYDCSASGKRWGSYSESQLREYFDSPQPALDETRKYIYSNLGAGLLGYALERKSGVSIEELINDRVCEPLGMTSTSTAIAPTTRGHGPDGNPTDLWPKQQSILGGAFALRSTCQDMLTFAKACLAPSKSKLKDALALSLQARSQINEVESTALGWKRNKYDVIYTTGATGGFRSALYLHTPTQTAVIVLANSRVGGVVGGRATYFDSFAGSLLNIAVGAPPIEIDFPSPLRNFEGNLQDFVGQYLPEDGGEDPSFPIRLSKNRLLTEGPGEIEMQLWPKKSDTFFLRAYNSEITFLRDTSGAVVGADVDFEGNHARLKRTIQ